MAPKIIKNADENKTSTDGLIESYKFSKKQLVQSQKYAGQRDLLNTLLKDDTRYSFDEVGSLITDFMEGKVK
ncbi:hypothetical protein ACP8HI_04485 [Paenibacillus sp. FA6]|uniref:hypothetical protein n=1 Tax=Paenibacillus sp. FA6 TaxID=3413029 RepID=UPI003F65827E